MLILLVALTLGSAGQRVEATLPVPSPVRQFLKTHPQYRLLARTDVDTNDLEADEPLWAFQVAELTGDSFADVVAVVVRKGRTPGYGLVAFHGSARGFGRAIWILPPGTVTLHGVSTDDGKVSLLECIHCDSNSFARWNGNRYEGDLYAVGETVSVWQAGCSRECDVFLRQQPSITSPAADRLPECSDITIDRVMPGNGRPYRWYRVRAEVGATERVGYLRGDSLTSVSCIG
jgi:hypothetical protein